MYEKVRLSSYRFLSWLILKLQAVGTEEEALERILSSRIPHNVPKKKTNRKQDLPDGGPRYGPQTAEFYASMVRKEERAKKGKRKVSSTTTSTDDAGSPPPITSKPAKRVRKTGPKT